jgi:hypothetical protein
MRNLKNLNVIESIKCKKLIYTETWLDKLDKIANYLFFSWCFILPFLVYNDPIGDFETTGIEYYLIFIFSIFCGYVIFRKVTEKNLTEIESQFDTEKNKEIINEYCQKMGFEKYGNSKNLIIFNSVNSLNPNYITTRIFLLQNKSVYLTMIRKSYRLNVPVLFSQLVLKRDLTKMLKQ